MEGGPEAQSGIKLNNVRNGIIEKNKIQNVDHRLSIVNSFLLLLSENSIVNSENSAINLVNSDQNTISLNNLKNNVLGVQLQEASINTIMDSIVKG